MIKIKSDCPEFNKLSELVNLETLEFIGNTLNKVLEVGGNKHMCPSTIMLVILSSVGHILKTALASDVETILFSESFSESEEDREKEVESMLEQATNLCFTVLEDSLPIDIHASSNVNRADAGKVLDFIEALDARQEGKSN